ncbi:related to nik-1 protein (Os-1p protein) [Phialocephala subalpina]|uniref:Related to nik-1 protein (Os-1p protein) n=1 Tax=Phialocephala subalpina TaxID=576137 RepID=A0A1L7WPL4_9HELO|nr:related to nik-1 protein (Os-1p protein) [Phialocephala subalpina]
MTTPLSNSHLQQLQCKRGATETPSMAASCGGLCQATMKINIGTNGEGPSRSMIESQRGLELRKFFAPHHASNTTVEEDFNDSLNSDGALDAYAETLVWRLKGVHAVLGRPRYVHCRDILRNESQKSIGTQYFLAGAIRISSAAYDSPDVDVITSDEWFGCSTVPTPGGLCENTLALDPAKDEYPCFIVNDLSKDDRFASLPVVDGTIVSYRFYAGAPITTNRGVNIGSLFLFDDKPRDGMTLKQRKFLHQQATNVMKHLETKREAAERRRVALMSKGIARFLERTAQHTSNEEAVEISGDVSQTDQSESIDNDNPTSNGTAASEPTSSSAIAKESVLDKIRYALDQAADILRESLELSVGGVVFLDTAKGYSETGNTEAYLDSTTDIGSHVEVVKREEKRRQKSHESSLRPTLNPEEDNNGRQVSQESTRSFSDEHRAAKVLAMSAAKIATWDPDANVLDAKTLQSLINTYPKGNVWYTDEEGYFSSLEQQNELQQTAAISPSGRRKSALSIDLTHQKAEATFLSRIFHQARQIIFLPLWDAGGDRWYSGCFVWSRSAVPVFTVESEVAYLSAFTNSVMVEISRLDAITSNKMKSDFISSISHEFRSPLHGILASAELLRESELDASQMEFISTITNCSGTLLDTINHVLDYSKINSFEKTGNEKGTIINELIQVTNLALLCEDIINGMIAAREFRGTDDPTSAISREFRSAAAHAPRNRRATLDIILDIERRDWYYNIQAGALRRVVMNIFGNAQKYTESGYISVQMRIQEGARSHPNGSFGNVLYLKIRDSGRGMSTEYMERKLYHPFAQEDSFAPGVGLGLSIVWSIVNQLGGQISIRSQIGKGTEVEVIIPVEKVEAPERDHNEPGSTNDILLDAQNCIARLQARATGKSICLSRVNAKDSRPKDITWSCIEKYCVDWFGFTVIKGSADLMITDHENEGGYETSSRILVVHDDMSCSAKHIGTYRDYAVGHICPPLGPFRLARCLMALMDQDLSLPTNETNPFHADRATQTPLGSPEERIIMNGIILTDYGFTPQTTLSNTPASLDSQERKEESDVILPTMSYQRESVQVDAITNALPQLTSQSPTTVENQPPSTSMPPPSSFGRLQLPKLKKPAVASTNTSKSLRILAVDDNALNLQLLQRYLAKRKSDTIVTARHGLEAVAAVKEAGPAKKFDIIFMDISMPNMNGFEATRAIRNIERKLSRRTMHTERNVLEPGSSEESLLDEKNDPVQRDLKDKDRSFIVALTGLASRRDRDEAEESGFDDFLTKPISFVKIGEMLEKMSEEKAPV